MILGDKIASLRKQNGWSQEELAEKMNVSRQAVSKWESAQSVPELEKILQLGELFGVTTDYLLKDDREDPEFAEGTPGAFATVRRVSMADAHAFLALRESAAGKIALGVALCVLSPAPLILLSAISWYLPFKLTENAAAGIGLVVLMVMVAFAVVLFVACGQASAPYEFLEKEVFETEYGVKGMVQERQKSYRNTYIRGNLVGVFLCILSPAPLFLSLIAENEALTSMMVGALFLFVAAGVVSFVLVGVRWASYQKLLQEGDFDVRKKAVTPVQKFVAAIYWPVVLAIYFIWSFPTGEWGISWIVWPIAAALYGAVMAFCGGIDGNGDRQ